MASLNSCSFTGRAGRDPEVRYFESGKVVCNFSIAIDSWKQDDEPLWLPLTIWGKTAQVAADYIRKGSLIAVSGELGEERWVDRTSGEQRKKTVLNVRALTLLEPKRDDDGGEGWGGDGPDRAARPDRPPAFASGNGGYEDEDTPF